MPRPITPRRVSHRPQVVYFKPQGIPLSSLREEVLGLDELEALRLADVLGLSHEQVGEAMGVSRATAGRILARARKTVATALTRGHAVRLEGGTAHFDEDAPENAGGFSGRGRGRGHGGGKGRGHGGGRGRGHGGGER